MQNYTDRPVVILHCVAHNLELGVLDTVINHPIPYLDTFDKTVRQAFKFYFSSAKKRIEVNTVSEILAHFSSIIKKTG